MRSLNEINEAIYAAEDALVYLRRAAQCLSGARSLGAWDLLGGGFLSTMLKHNKLDKARVEMENAQDALRRFSRELRDVEELPELNLAIDDFLTFADYFMDGFVADVMVQRRIRSAQAQVEEAIRQVESILETLENMR